MRKMPLRSLLNQAHWNKRIGEIIASATEAKTQRERLDIAAESRFFRGKLL